ncbi:hypothetical protein BV22DRAFT_1041024 [Leucogyrophana mollusca]|uniref:Uncharacterized protein n=1 Tax=Leucogyrophana mollusca TaxID=85980 RepID=A0ACB8B0Z1_9AGAM|nr:hypothetical protein BV22DRAFT_1041024 [Leucogyrophana mollusca]
MAHTVSRVVSVRVWIETRCRAMFATLHVDITNDVLPCTLSAPWESILPCYPPKERVRIGGTHLRPQ